MKAARSGVWQLIGRKPLVFMFTGFCQIAEIKAKLILSIWWVEGGKNWPTGFKANQHWPLFKAGSPEQTYPHACLFAEFENLQSSRMHVNWYQKSSQIASRTHILMTANPISTFIQKHPKSDLRQSSLIDCFGTQIAHCINICSSSWKVFKFLFWTFKA